jgi:hypothetical protein
VVHKYNDISARKQSLLFFDFFEPPVYLSLKFPARNADNKGRDAFVCAHSSTISSPATQASTVIAQLTALIPRENARRKVRPHAKALSASPRCDELHASVWPNHAAAEMPSQHVAGAGRGVI